MEESEFYFSYQKKDIHVRVFYPQKQKERAEKEVRERLKEMYLERIPNLSGGGFEYE